MKSTKRKVVKKQTKAPTLEFTPERAYLVIVEWLFKNDGAFTSKVEWRKALLGHLIETFQALEKRKPVIRYSDLDIDDFDRDFPC